MIFGDDGLDKPLPGYEYEGPSCICLDEAGSPYLVIYNQEWVGDLASLEKILYEEFYLPEICGQGGD